VQRSNDLLNIELKLEWAQRYMTVQCDDEKDYKNFMWPVEINKKV